MNKKGKKTTKIYNRPLFKRNRNLKINNEGKKKEHEEKEVNLKWKKGVIFCHIPIKTQTLLIFVIF